MDGAIPNRTTQHAQRARPDGLRQLGQVRSDRVRIRRRGGQAAARRAAPEGFPVAQVGVPRVGRERGREGFQNSL